MLNEMNPCLRTLVKHKHAITGAGHLYLPETPITAAKTALEYTQSNNDS